MTRQEIVERLAKERRVETMLRNIAKTPVSGDLEDLCQMVYLTLLTFDEAKVVDLWEKEQINFFIARILMNQYQSVKSPFFTTFRKRQRRQVPIEDYLNLADDE